MQRCWKLVTLCQENNWIESENILKTIWCHDMLWKPLESSQQVYLNFFWKFYLPLKQIGSLSENALIKSTTIWFCSDSDIRIWFSSEWEGSEYAWKSDNIWIYSDVEHLDLTAQVFGIWFHSEILLSSKYKYIWFYPNMFQWVIKLTHCVLNFARFEFWWLDKIDTFWLSWTVNG